jgi:hypothetical protein
MTTSGPDPAVLDAIQNRGNGVVFLDVAMEDVPLGRIKLELFVEDVRSIHEI